MRAQEHNKTAGKPLYGLRQLWQWGINGERLIERDRMVAQFYGDRENLRRESSLPDERPSQES